MNILFQPFYYIYLSILPIEKPKCFKCITIRKVLDSNTYV